MSLLGRTCLRQMGTLHTWKIPASFWVHFHIWQIRWQKSPLCWGPIAVLCVLACFSGKPVLCVFSPCSALTLTLTLGMWIHTAGHRGYQHVAPILSLLFHGFFHDEQAKHRWRHVLRGLCRRSATWKGLHLPGISSVPPELAQ